MARNRLRIGVLVALIVVVGASWISWEHRPTGHDLDRFGKGGMSNRFFDFDDGSQLSVGSPDRHRVVVQWKVAGDQGWTAPTTVYMNTKYPTYDNTIRQGGTTVAIQQVFSFESGTEDDEASLEVHIVCDGTRRECEVREDPDHSGPPQVTADGRTALLGFDSKPRRAVLWSADDGFRLKRLSVPAGAPLNIAGLAADGSLRGIVETPQGQDCLLTLFAGAPRSGDLKAVAEVKRTYPCGDNGTDNYAVGGTADWVEVANETWLVRSGSQWRSTSKDPSGLIQVPYEPGCRPTVQTQYENRPNLSYSSPDGRHFQVQVRRLSSATWSKPVRVEAVPADPTVKGGAWKCAGIRFAKVGSRGYALALIGRAPGYGRAIAVTRDLRHWEAEFIPGARGNLHVDKNHRVLIGTSVEWTPDTGLTAQD